MSDDTAKKIIITGASVIVGYGLKQMAKNKWVEVYDEEPPTTKHTEEIDWKKVVLWSVVTGTIISSAKLATKRYLTLKLDS